MSYLVECVLMVTKQSNLANHGLPCVLQTNLAADNKDTVTPALVVQSLHYLDESFQPGTSSSSTSSDSETSQDSQKVFLKAQYPLDKTESQTH